MEINDTKPEGKLIHSSKTFVCACVCACHLPAYLGDNIGSVPDHHKLSEYCNKVGHTDFLVSQWM